MTLEQLLLGSVDYDQSAIVQLFDEFTNTQLQEENNPE